MKFKSHVFAQASGSVAGLVYSRNRYGKYCRERASITNPNTPFQVAIRSAMTVAHKAWDALDEASKDSWESYAAATPIRDRLGELIYITGRLMFIRQKILRIQTSVSSGTVVPSTPGLTALTKAELSVEAPTDGSIAFANTDEWAKAAGGFLALFVSRPQGAGISYFKGPYRYAGKVAGAATPPTSPQSIILPFNYQAGDKVFYRCIAVSDDNRLSEEIFGVTTVTS